MSSAIYRSFARPFRKKKLSARSLANFLPSTARWLRIWKPVPGNAPSTCNDFTIMDRSRKFSIQNCAISRKKDFNNFCQC
jgi:hypothetical protein